MENLVDGLKARERKRITASHHKQKERNKLRKSIKLIQEKDDEIKKYTWKSKLTV